MFKEGVKDFEEKPWLEMVLSQLCNFNFLMFLNSNKDQVAEIAAENNVSFFLDHTITYLPC